MGETRGYDRMEEDSSANTDERHVIYPMVTYNPETVESHPELKGQHPRRIQQRVLRCMFLINLSNTVVAVVCMIFACIARSMSGSNYEPSVTVCSMVIVDSCLVWCLRYQGKRISQEGAIENLWTTRIFSCCFISVVVLAVCSVVVAGIALYVLEHGELNDCYKAFSKVGDLEMNPCKGDSESRYFMSILTVTLLAAMGVLSLLTLGFCFSIARKFSFKSATAVDRSRVVVTQVDETGQKVVYRYTDQQDVSPEDEQHDDEHRRDGQGVQLMNSEV